MHDIPARLARIDALVAEHRTCYLRAELAGHQGEAEWHERSIDRLLDFRNRVERGPLALIVKEPA